MVRVVLYGIAAVVLATFCSAKSYEGYSLIRASPDTQDEADYLNSLEENPSGFDVQLWAHGNAELPFDILISPQSKAAFENELRERQIDFQVQNENIQESIERENRPPHARAFAGGSIVTRKFMTLDEINTYIQSLAQNFPNLVQVEQIGTSHENRPIYVVKVSSSAGGENKPSIWIDGGIHAREWVAVSSVTYMLNKLVTGYESDAKIKNLVDKATWYISPVLNVDGYLYSHTTDRSWRKNRRPAECDGPKCCAGVDLNRNFNYSFGGAGRTEEAAGTAAKFPVSCQYTYRGPEAFSEPESIAIRDFVLKHAANMKAFISIHAYSQMWFYPFADKRQSYPEDGPELVALAKKAALALAKVHGTKMQVGTPADIFYPAGGSSLDWVKAVANVKYVYALELRPGANTVGDGFVLPANKIVPTGEETWAGISVVAEEVVNKFGN